MSKKSPSYYCCTLSTAALVLLLTAHGAFAFSASFTWCPGSPRFQMSDVPQSTAKLTFQMTDLNKPNFHHGVRNGGLPRTERSVVRRVRERLRRSVAAARRSAHLRVHCKSARR